MTFSGDLRGISLADVFQNIAGNRGSGTLRVQWRNTERFVRFENGQVAGFSLGVRKGLPIQDHLVQRGYVDAGKLRDLLTRRKRSRKTPGRLIVEAGLLTEEEMSDAIAELIAEHVYDLMTLRDAKFAFHDGDPPPQVFGADQQAFQVRLESGPLLVEGARRVDEWEQIRRVVGSDRDLFVLLEGWDEQELSQLAREIAPHLDGRTDILTLLHDFSASRFEIVKAVCTLVSRGAARPCSAQEIESFAREALDAGENDTALRLMRQALELERSNTELRHEFADLLERLGRPVDAASEHALLGFQAARDGEIENARLHYELATELNPSDPVLCEQRVELLRRTDDRQALASAVLDLSAVWLSMGLADRARELLAKTLAENGLSDDVALGERLAEVEARLGRVEEAGKIYEKLADQLLEDDEARALEYLRLAQHHRPDDEALASKLSDIETGQRARRQRRRRLVAAAAACGAVLLAIGTAGVAELAASRQVVHALDRGLDSLSHGRASSTITDLRAVQQSYGWTPSGHRAAMLLRRLVRIQLDTARDLSASGQHERARVMLRELEPIVAGTNMQVQLDELRAQLQLEEAAAATLERAAGQPVDGDGMAARRLADPRLLGFHLRQLSDLSDPGARQLVLRALARIDSPRALPAAARLFLVADDPETLGLLRRLLDRAPAYRGQGHEPVWALVYPELEDALSDAALAPRARAALALLRERPAK